MIEKFLSNSNYFYTLEKEKERKKKKEYFKFEGKLFYRPNKSLIANNNVQF